MQEYCIQYFKNLCFGHLLELPQVSKTYVLGEEINTKHDLSYISICSFSILHNSKFVLMAVSLGTNGIVVTRVHYICNLELHQN